MFRGPLLMQQGASLTRALSLFRQMGLHHILIAPPDPRAIGFVTRRVSRFLCTIREQYSEVFSSYLCDAQVRVLCYY